MRTVVVGVDGLDYNLVHLFELKNLPQQHCGTVSAKEFAWHGSDDPFTPTVWASFLTGLSPAEHGVYAIKVLENPLMDLLYQIQLRLGICRILPFSIEKVILNPLGLNKRREDNRALWEINKHYFAGKGIDTIFELTRSSEAFNVPVYNRAPQIEVEDTLLTGDFLNKKLTKREYLDRIHLLIEQEKRQFLDIINNNNQLVMVYTHVADAVGHCLRGDLIAMWEIYQHLDQVFRALLSRLEEDTFVLVVSDHGMNRWKIRGMAGRHSYEAFYSSNQPLARKPTSLTGFKEIIREKLAQ